MQRADFEKKLRAASGRQIQMSDEALIALIYALKIRVIHLVQQSVIFAQRRTGRSVPSDRYFFDVPMGKFAQLAAEKAVLTRGMRIADRIAENVPPVFEKLRNDAISGIAGQLPESKREELLTVARDVEEQEGNVDMGLLLQLLPGDNQSRAVTLKDVVAVLEIDRMLSTDQQLFRCKGFARIHRRRPEGGA
jgi:hypothetical protein